MELSTHAGVAVGKEFCNAESPALRDSTVWVITVHKYCKLIHSHVQYHYNIAYYVHVCTQILNFSLPYV